MSEFEFNTKEKANEWFTNPGERYQTEYTPVVQPNGRIEIVPTGKKDIFQEIQSWRDATDMHFILAQMAQGKYEPRSGAMYGDFTVMPETPVETMQLMINSEKAFYDLPVDVRKKFDNDWHQWMVSATSDYEGFSKKMGFVSDQMEIKIDESKGDVKE